MLSVQEDTGKEKSERKSIAVAISTSLLVQQAGKPNPYFPPLWHPQFVFESASIHSQFQLNNM